MPVLASTVDSLVVLAVELIHFSSVWLWMGTCATCGPSASPSGILVGGTAERYKIRLGSTGKLSCLVGAITVTR